MLKVTLDENNYVTGWCMVGDNGGVAVELPDDLDGFMECFTAYHVIDGKLVLDAEKDEADRLEMKRESLRRRREEECFPVINRGWYWYLALTPAQKRELRTWYLAWLNVTETMSPPERPFWIDATDTSRIPRNPGGLF